MEKVWVSYFILRREKKGKKLSDELSTHMEKSFKVFCSFMFFFITICFYLDFFGGGSFVCAQKGKICSGKYCTPVFNRLFKVGNLVE